MTVEYTSSLDRVVLFLGNFKFADSALSGNSLLSLSENSRYDFEPPRDEAGTSTSWLGGQEKARHQLDLVLPENDHQSPWMIMEYIPRILDPGGH
ncbi:hypothetical protein VD0002_g4214 [Verticillium dahliae]|uniref:Uncharacterized protein n=1 Tax=Verticillium dahliae TaxID=27337 RepID=A0AA44W7S7_VERDA|nr:hypothetical protein BJF96_g10252 [Verticillium dahliae]PNH43378.1 hypothetical protein VD0004_g4067 [Verticillium dahliae]PNH51455.1 hypothetical protein VD0003_g5789 [Verticillium dahliae]PNH64459.1 hypothetical protein VD0002_g4214 [Verticillium dahliae]PNH73084.1 hypothetical protein VD0001_g4467 [Verticillium dahliae]